MIVLDADGREVFRNPAAERYREARHADAVVAGALDALVVARAATASAANASCSSSARRGRSCTCRRSRSATDERPLGVAAFVDDVSEVHRIESVRRDFVANVSHELKTPIGALEVLAETLVAERRPDGRRASSPSGSCKEADGSARIVDDLLDLSLIEAQEAPRREPVPVERPGRRRGRPRAAGRRGRAASTSQVAPGVTDVAGRVRPAPGA